MKFRYYNRSLISNFFHGINNYDANNELKLEKRALFAIYPTNFDESRKIGWFYVIKDSIFKIENLKSKDRNYIKKSVSSFLCKKIDPNDFETEILDIANHVARNYGVTTTVYCENDLNNWKSPENDFFGVFDKNKCRLLGWALLSKYGDHIDFSILKIEQEAVKKGASAALIYHIVNQYKKYLLGGGIINDGSRNMLHETNFQDYLIRYFGFRKCYADLNIVYKGYIKFIIFLIYPFRNVFKNSHNIFLKKIHTVLLLESIRRNGDIQ